MDYKKSIINLLTCLLLSPVVFYIFIGVARIAGSSYKISNGENDEPIYVTGSHLVFNGDKFDYVRNYKHATICENNTKELSCLITSDNKIHIGEHIFWDYDDTPEMVADLK